MKIWSIGTNRTDYNNGITGFIFDNILDTTEKILKLIFTSQIINYIHWQ